MNRANLFLMIGLVAGTGLGLLASGTFAVFGSGADGSASMTEMGHDHSRMQEVPADRVPLVDIVLQSEGPCTYNLQLILTNFAFAPEKANGPHADGTGHAHLYADGKKLARIYSEWFHFTAPKGSQTIEITLNSNDHATLVHQDTPISASAPLTDC